MIVAILIYCVLIMIILMVQIALVVLDRKKEVALQQFIDAERAVLREQMYGDKKELLVDFSSVTSQFINGAKDEMFSPFSKEKIIDIFVLLRTLSMEEETSEILENLNIGLKHSGSLWSENYIIDGRVIYWSKGTVTIVVGDNAKLIKISTYGGSYAKLENGEFFAPDYNVPGAWWAYVNSRVLKIHDALEKYKDNIYNKKKELLQKYFINPK